MESGEGSSRKRKTENGEGGAPEKRGRAEIDNGQAGEAVIPAGDIGAVAGEKEMNAEDGQMVVAGDFPQAGEKEMNAEDGKMVVDGDFPQAGEKEMNAEDGKMVVDGDFPQAGEIEMNAADGQMIVDGEIEMNAEDGQMVVAGDFPQAGEIEMNAAGGEMVVDGNFPQAVAVAEHGNMMNRLVMLPDDILRSIFSLMSVEAKGRFATICREFGRIANPLLAQHPYVILLRAVPDARAEHALNIQREFDNVAVMLGLMNDGETVIQAYQRLQGDEDEEDDYSFEATQFLDAFLDLEIRRRIENFDKWTKEKIAAELHTGGVYDGPHR